MDPNCRKPNIDDSRMISYEFDTGEYVAYQCRDLSHVCAHLDTVILHQLRRHEYDYNLTHSNKIPLLVGLENAEQIARRVLSYNNQYSNDAIAVRQCVSVFFFLLLTGIDSGELPAQTIDITTTLDDTIDIETITLEETENDIGSIINDIQTINEQFDELVFP